MTNSEIASALQTIGDVLDLKGENPFRVRAYQRAALTITSLPRDLIDVYEDGGLDALMEIPGIGKDLAAKIEELLKTGKLQYLKDLEKEVPKGLIDVMNVEGMGPKKTKQLWQKFKIKNVADLEKVAKSGKLEEFPGWGEKSVEKVIKAIATKRDLGARVRINEAWDRAEEIRRILLKTKLCKQLEIAGSLRRRKETIGDIDLLATSDKPEKVMDAFCAMTHVERIIGRGPTKVSVMLKSGMQADLRVLDPEVFGAAMHYFTGSKEHNVKVRTMAQKKGITLNEYGAFEGTAEKKGKRVACRTEEEVFAAVGLPYIPPELREDRGEIEAALKGSLPDLIKEGDLKGDLHVHSDFSDGNLSMIKMAEAAKKAGLQYLAFTDHASSMGMVGGIKDGNIEEYLTLIKAAQKAVPGIRLFAGAEVDIQPDGSLYLSDASLAKLDWVVASIHGNFNQTREEMTKRLVRAVSHPSVRLLGHPTGRLLVRRAAYEFDAEKVFAAAKKNGVAMELNASVERLDLSDVLLRRAKETGLPICIDSDAHGLSDFDLRFGITQARRGWIEKADVINVKPLKAFESWLRKAKG